MKTLKKTLCLVLVVCMVLSLGAINVGAAFDDADDITFTEAVNAMTDLGIINGYDDGSFQPTTIVTREQAAKIVAYMMLGASAADALKATYSPFKDVAASRWSAGYIAYCTNAGIINGYGDGNFGPADEVTGYQFGKMLLVALGYGQAGEYTGTTWSINVAKDALVKGVYEGNLDANFNAGATREAATLYAFNSLFIETVNAVVQYDNGTKYVTGYNGTDTTLGYTLYKLAKVSGAITSIDPTNGTTTINVTDSDVLAAGSYIVAANASWEDIGKTGTAYVKLKAANTIKSTYSETVAISDTVKSTSTNGTKLADMTTSSKSAFVANMESAPAANPTYVMANVDVYVNGQEDTTTFATVTNTTAFDTLYAKPGIEITLLDNNSNGKIDTILVYKYDVAKVSAYSTLNDGSISFDNAGGAFTVTGSWDPDLVVGFDKVAKGDYVTGVAYGNHLYITPAEKVTGTFNSISGKTVNGSTVYSYKVDSTSYTISGTPYADNPNTVLVDGAINGSVDLYLDSNGYILAASGTVAAVTNIVYVSANDARTIAGVSARMHFSDGTTSVGAIYKVGSTLVSAMLSTDVEADDFIGLYSYTNGDNGYTLTALPTTGTTGNIAVILATGSVSKTSALVATGVYANSSTIFVDCKNNVAYTGYTNLPGTVSYTSGAYAYKMVGGPSGQKIATVVYLGGTSATATSTTKFFIADPAAYETSTINGTVVRTYLDVIVNGEVKDVVVDATEASTAITTAGLYEISATNAAGTVTDIGTTVLVAAMDDAIVYCADGTLVYDTTSTITLTDSTVYVLYDSARSTATLSSVDYVSTGTSVYVVASPSPNTDKAAYVYIIK
jgi:hypothetical protein